MPSGGRSGSRGPHIRADDLFNGTPLEGARVEGLLRPALLAAQGYIRTYFGDTNAYYTRLEAKLDAQLALAPVDLPTGDGLAQLGFVTDRHCNTGMDRVVVVAARALRRATLASAGDDAFSGSFGFEAACTRNLAERTHRAGITDVFVGGNHDSPQTARVRAQAEDQDAHRPGREGRRPAVHRLARSAHEPLRAGDPAGARSRRSMRSSTPRALRSAGPPARPRAP